MHFEGICGLKTELNYPFNTENISENLSIIYQILRIILP